MNIFSEKRILSVSQLTALVRGVLEENFEHVWVQGEVSNVSAPASGHLYFTLKDAGAQIRCVLFRSTARNLRFRLLDGMGLILRGRISVFDQRGEYQLIGDIVEPQGVGALQLALDQLKERLAKEGLFDDKRKRPLPQLPQRIGIVTSPTGAAVHDILQVINRRFANLHILLRPVKVQGEGAAEEIAAAISDFNRYGEIDVMIVGRGGGSLEDLWAFNEEIVARAIAKSRIPIISAVGHEIDFSIADLVADVRAPTPSAAAEMVVRSKDELHKEVLNLSHRLIKTMEHSLLRRRSEVSGLTRLLKDPSLLLGQLHQRVDDLSERLHLAMRVRMARHNEAVLAMRRQLRLVNPAVQVERRRECLLALFSRMELAMQATVDAAQEETRVAAARLHALSPVATLGRGYSITRLLPERKVVKSAADVRPGDRVEVVFGRGSARCSVDATEE